MAYVTVSADVDVDLDDVFEAASEDELRAALKRRKVAVSDAMFAPFRDDGKKIKAAIWQAILDGDYEAAADMFSPFVSPEVNFREKSYETLKRDPATGRPVIQ